jgi:hypothetical protein
MSHKSGFSTRMLIDLQRLRGMVDERLDVHTSIDSPKLHANLIYLRNGVIGAIARLESDSLQRANELWGRRCL